MGGYDTMTVIPLVDLNHAGQVYKAGTVATVPSATAVRWLMQKQAKTAPKGSVPTPAPSHVTSTPETPRPDRPTKKAKKDSSPTAAPDAAASEDRTYQRRDLVPEE